MQAGVTAEVLMASADQPRGKGQPGDPPPSAEATASSSLGGAYPPSSWTIVRRVAIAPRSSPLLQRFLYTACYCGER